MIPVSNLLDLNKLKQQREQTPPDPLTQETAEVINWLFSELRSSFTAFKQAWSNPDDYRTAKKTWLKAFMLAGINKVEQLQHGLNHCYLMATPFVPSPGEFISWCQPRPEDLGLFVKEHAYLKAIEFLREGELMTLSEAQKTVFTHALNYTGRYDMRNKPESQIRPIFERNYEISLRDFITGKLQAIPKALEDNSHETEELIRAEHAKGKFKHITGYTDAVAEIRKMIDWQKEHVIDAQEVVLS